MLGCFVSLLCYQNNDLTNLLKSVQKSAPECSFESIKKSHKAMETFRSPLSSPHPQHLRELIGGSFLKVRTSVLLPGRSKDQKVKRSKEYISVRKKIRVRGLLGKGHFGYLTPKNMKVFNPFSTGCPPSTKSAK